MFHIAPFGEWRLTANGTCATCRDEAFRSAFGGNPDIGSSAVGGPREEPADARSIVVAKGSNRTELVAMKLMPASSPSAFGIGGAS
jgi:hypothetical protein